MAINISTAACTAVCNSIVDLIDVGGVGFMRIYSAASNMLVNVPLSATAFGAAAVSGTTGQASAVIATASGVATAGTAAYFTFLNTATATIFWGTCSTANGDLNISNLVFASGDVIVMSAFTFVVEQG
jgi:hypothetical protein